MVKRVQVFLVGVLLLGVLGAGLGTPASGQYGPGDGDADADADGGGDDTVSLVLSAEVIFRGEGLTIFGFNYSPNATVTLSLEAAGDGGQAAGVAPGGSRLATRAPAVLGDFATAETDQNGSFTLADVRMDEAPDLYRVVGRDSDEEAQDDFRIVTATEAGSGASSRGSGARSGDSEGGGLLARTGTSIGLLLLIAVVLIAAGSLLVLRHRKRHGLA